MALAVAWGLWELRPELRAVPYLDDSSLHEQMVRVGREPDPPGPPAAHELVPLPRAGVTPVPALPEPAVHDRGDDRHGGRPGYRVPLVDIPAARAVATRRVLERPALRPQPVDRRLGCGRLAVPGLGSRHRLRDEGLRLGRLRGVDPAVGVVDAAVGVGLHLPGTEDAAGRAARRPLHHADGRPALRDRVPRVRPPRGVALPGALGPVAPAGARRRARRRRGGGVGLGHRPAARPVTLGGAQPGARRHRARERVRRPSDAVVVVLGPALRRGALGRRDRARRRRYRGLHRALALQPGGAGPRRASGW